VAFVLFAAFVNLLLLRFSSEYVELSFGEIVAHITVPNLDFVSFALWIVRSSKVGFNLAQNQQEIAQRLDLYCQRLCSAQRLTNIREHLSPLLN
jgi:hypothetical protein